jgi:hypothetical protein
VLLVPAFALVVAAPSGADQGCPSPRLITDALNARMPDIVAPPSDASPSGGLRLAVTGGGTPASLRIELSDQNGEARLLRVLQPSDRGRPGDCVALAETVALIVDRYLHEVGYELPSSPPPPPPPVAPQPVEPAPPAAPPAAADVISGGPGPRGPPAGATHFDLLAGGAWRGASTGSGPEAAIGLGAEWGFGAWRAGATLTGGVAATQSVRAPDATATLRRFPVHLGFFLGLPAGPGQVEPGVGVGVDWLAANVDWTTRGPSSSEMRASPGADLALGYRMFMAGRFFVRAAASATLSVPYLFVASPQTGGRVGTEAFFSSPRTSFRSGLEVGVAFR